MNKILRKYKKPLIVVGGTLLMIAWAMSGSMNQMGGDPRSRVVGNTSFGRITAEQQAEYDAQFKVMQDFLPFLVRNGAMNIENGTHFHLMALEAQKAGFEAGAEDGRQWFEELKTLPNLQQEAAQDLYRQWAQRAQEGKTPNPQPTNEDVAKHTADLLQALARRAMGSRNFGDEQFFAALGRARAISRYVTSFQFAPRVSDRRLANKVVAEGDIALVDALVIPADRVLDKVAMPTPEELQAQFDKFKSTKPGEGELGAGYYQPARVKIEWLKLDRAAVANAIDLDPIEVSKRYKANRIKFAGEFAAEKDKVEKELRDELTARLMTDADRVIRAEMLKATAKLPAEGQYKKLPADWDSVRPTLEAIAQAVVREVKMPGGVGSFPLPLVVSKASAWLKPADLATLDGIGNTELRIGNKRDVFSRIIFLAKEFGFPNDLSIQRGMPYVDNALLDADQNRYYFTLLDLKAEGPAETLDDCRDDVTRDVRRAKGVALLKAELDRFKSIAIEKGLDAIAAEFPAAGGLPALTVRTRTPISRTLAQDSELNTPDLRDTIMALATKIDPTKEASVIPAADRTLAAALAKTPAVLVAQITAHIPATVEVFRANDFQLTSQYVGEELSAANTREKVFSYAAMRERLRYVPVGGVGEESSDSEPASTPSGTPGTPSPASAPTPAKS